MPTCSSSIRPTSAPALSVALIQIAEGNPRAAASRLDDLEGARRRPISASLTRSPAAPTAPCRSSKTAARAPGATARTRQNLALAYAMTGDWRRARAVAAQDLSPAELPAPAAAMGGLRPARRRRGPRRRPARRDSGRGSRPAGPPRARPRPRAGPGRRRSGAAARSAAPAPAAAPAAPVQVAEARPAEAPAFWVPTAQSYQAPPEAPVERGRASDRARRAAARGPRPICLRRAQPWSRPSRP